MLPERCKRNDVERPLMRRREDDVCSRTIFMGPEPVDSGDAPTVARDEPWKAVHRHWRGQIVTDSALMFQKLPGHNRTDRVAARVLRAGMTAAVTVEAGDRVASAGLKLTPEDIPLAHRASIARSGTLVSGTAG